MPKIDIYQGSFLVFVFLLLGSFLIMLPSLSSIQLSSVDIDKDGINDSQEISEGRTLKVVQLPNLVGINSEFESNTTENEMGFFVNTFSGIKVLSRYSSETENNGTESAFKIFYYVQFRKLIEIENNQTLKEMDLTKKDYSPIKVSSIFSDDNEAGYNIEVQSSDSMFIIRAFVFRHYALVNNTLLSPQDIKLEIEIRNFPFISTTSQLKLELLLLSKTMIKTEVNDVETLVSNTKGYFKWDTKIITKLSTVEEIENESEVSIKPPVINKTGELNQDLPIRFDESFVNTSFMEIIYPHATTIIHDPIIGFQDIQQPTIQGIVQGMIFSISFWVGSVLVLFSVSIIILNRKKIMKVFK